MTKFDGKVKIKFGEKTIKTTIKETTVTIQALIVEPSRDRSSFLHQHFKFTLKPHYTIVIKGLFT